MQKKFNLKRITNQNGSKQTSSEELSVPFNELAYTFFANSLWKNGGKDRALTYQFSDEKVSSNSAVLKSCAKSFILDLLEEIDNNTSLTFQEAKGKKADLIIGAQTNQWKELSLSKTSKGISFAWPFDNNPRCSKPISSSDKKTVTQDLGWALGLRTLGEKSEFKYTFSDSAMAWDYENKFLGFTSTDYAVIDQVWNSF